MVCTDAGLSSAANRKYNDIGGRAFITAQSIKKLKKYLKEWVLDFKDWRLPRSDVSYDITTVDEAAHKESTFYKERWVNEDGFEQKLIVTYSIKHRDYQRNIRDGQAERARKLVETNPVYLKRDDRIMAHFTTCFISLLIYRLLEKRLRGQFTCSQIIRPTV
ncbi:MAG: hypothetical protein LBS19_00090 [Clostridiales bacterium]|nr:hypothetical protein [Clostridiales bacterium]